MSRSCEVQTAGGAAVVVRRATGSVDAALLRATGERLAAAAHPGVVEVLSSTGTDDLWELQLVHAGRPVDVLGPLSVEQVAGLAAAVAATLADLHAAGIVHGDIDGSHVIVGPHGRPVLCGFGPSPRGAARPEDDVAALGALMVALLGTDADVEPIPDRRWRRGSWTGWARRSLLLLSDQACAEPPTRRPSARRLAAAIADAVPGAVAAVSPGPGAPTASPAALDDGDPEDPLDALRPPADDASPSPRLRALVCAVLGVVALGAGALWVARPVGQTTAAPRSAALETATTAPTRPPLPPTTSTVVVGSRHYEVGRAGDLVVVGDWDGDGVPTAAVLRPETGEVFVFPSWTDGDDIVVHPVATVDGAVELLVTEAADRDQLVVRRNDGSQHPIVAAART